MSRPVLTLDRDRLPLFAAAGINYLNLIDTAHGSELEQPINYAALLGDSPGPDPRTPAAPGPLPGQMTLDEALSDTPQEHS